MISDRGKKEQKRRKNIYLFNAFKKPLLSSVSFSRKALTKTRDLSVKFFEVGLYMHLISDRVERERSRRLPEKIAIIKLGWEEANVYLLESWLHLRALEKTNTEPHRWLSRQLKTRQARALGANWISMLYPRQIQEHRRQSRRSDRGQL